MQVLVQNFVATMSSPELVDFINADRKEGEPELRHDHFLAKVPKVIGIDAPKFLGTQTYGNNNTRAIYNLPKREACLMAMSYSYELQAKVFDRMTALEAQQNKAPAFEIPTTLSGALRLAAAQAETIEKQDAILLEQAPKMAVYELLADRKKDVCTTIVAKQLGTTAPKLNDFLREHGVKMMHAQLPKAGYINWFNVVSVIANGQEHLQCLITPYGQIEITKLWNTHKIKNILQKVPKLL